MVIVVCSNLHRIWESSSDSVMITQTYRNGLVPYWHATHSSILCGSNQMYFQLVYLHYYMIKRLRYFWLPARKLHWISYSALVMQGGKSIYNTYIVSEKNVTQLHTLSSKVRLALVSARDDDYRRSILILTSSTRQSKLALCSSLLRVTSGSETSFCHVCG